MSASPLSRTHSEPSGATPDLQRIPSQRIESTRVEVVSVARIATMVALGVLSLLINFLLLPFQIALAVTVIEAIVVSIFCCPDGNGDPCYDPINSTYPGNRSRPAIPVFSPSPIYATPQRTYEPIAFPVPIRTTPPILDSRPRERVGDGHINRGPISSTPNRVVSMSGQAGGGPIHPNLSHREPAPTPHPILDSRPREPVGRGHINPAPISPPVLPSVSMSAPREPVGRGHVDRPSVAPETSQQDSLKQKPMTHPPTLSNSTPLVREPVGHRRKENEI